MPPWSSCCWICGQPVPPESIYGAGQHEFHCKACDVKWVDPEYWLASNVWKDQKGYAGYKDFRHKYINDEMKRFRVKELVEFNGPEAPGAPA